MLVNTNISSLLAQESFTNTNNSIKSSLEKLSTGLKINKASDDSSGLAIADKLRTQATSINQGILNGNSAVSLLQIADKSMEEQSNILDTIKSKLIQANTDTTSDEGKEAIRKDINKLLTQFNTIAKQTNYNGRQLISNSEGTGTASIHSFQVGEKSSAIISTTSIQANLSGLPEAGVTTNTHTLVNQTLNNPGDTLSLDTSDEKFDLSVNGFSRVKYDGVGGIITAGSRNLIIFVNDGSAIDTFLEANAVTNIGFTDGGGGTFTLSSGSSLNLGIQSYSDFDIAVSTSADTYTFNNGDLTKVETTTGNPTIITGTKDKISVSGGLKLSDLNAIGEDALTKSEAATYQVVVDDSINKLNSYRADIGSTQNQVESGVRNLMTQATNVKAAESIIRDINYAKESANFNKLNIISQAGSYAISQANNTQQNVLRLLQ